MNKDGNKTKKSPVQASGTESKRNDDMKMDQQGQQGHGQQGQGSKKPAVDGSKSNSTTKRDQK